MTTLQSLRRDSDWLIETGGPNSLSLWHDSFILSCPGLTLNPWSVMLGWEDVFFTTYVDTISTSWMLTMSE